MPGNFKSPSCIHQIDPMCEKAELDLQLARTKRMENKPCKLCAVVLVRSKYVESLERVAIDAQESKSNRLVLFEDEVGEAYHVLFSHLSLRWSGVPLAPITSDVHTVKKEDMSEIAQLFKFYQVPYAYPVRSGRIDKKATRAGSRSREVATDRVTCVFRRCLDSSRTEVTESSLAVPVEEAVFDGLREMLDPICRLDADKTADKTQDVPSDHFRPSWAAKHWLKKYLRLTQKRTLPKRTENGVLKVTNLAVIHVRREAASGDKRKMDDGLLKYVATSIQRANARAIVTKESPFSHVALYGDFASTEGAKMVETLNRAFKQANSLEVVGTVLPRYKGEIKVFYISRPWLLRGNEDEIEDTSERDPKIKKLWKTFRDPASDPLPLQVKILAVWTMLCKRYSPNICIIAHRSGFVEGAAMTGIPVFFLNDKRPPSDENPNKLLDGRILWKPVKLAPKNFSGQNPAESVEQNSAAAEEEDEKKQVGPDKAEVQRLAKLANAMSTLTRIEVLRATTNTDLPHRPSQSLVNAQKSRQLQSRQDQERYQKHRKRGGDTSASQEASAKKSLEVNGIYKDELMAALFMYMCCSLTPSRHKSSPDLQHQKNFPGWMARACMIHDARKPPSRGVVGLQDRQTGQEWLETRYKFAVHTDTNGYLKFHKPTKHTEGHSAYEVDFKDWTAPPPDDRSPLGPNDDREGDDPS